MRQCTHIQFSCSLFFSLFCTGVFASQNVMSFGDAWRLTERQNSNLQASGWQVASSVGALRQSKLLPNPNIGITVENVAGSGVYRGSDLAEITYQINQPIQLGSKRFMRQQVALANNQLQIKNYHAARASLYTKFGQNFVDVLVAEQWHSVCQRMFRINRGVVEAIKTRMQAGRASKLDLDRAEVMLGDATLLASQALTQFNIAKNNLATLWGSDISFVKHFSEHGLPHRLPSKIHCKKFVLQSPLLTPYQGAINLSQAKIAASKSEVWPDLSVGIGLRHFNQTNDHALVAQVAMPLPIFDRNQGSRMEATANYSKSVSDAHQATLDLQQQVLNLYRTAEQAALEARVTNNSLLPKARDALRLATEGFKQGRYSSIELASAQQLLLTEEQHYWQAHAARDKAIISLSAILGLYPNNNRGDHV